VQWWLNVFFFINGVWIPGHEISGWSAREQPYEAVCIERNEFREARMRQASAQNIQLSGSARRESR
jgi:hypothetical protein